MVIERCEHRRLLSVAVVNGSLRIFTSDAVDNIEFSEANATTLRVKVNGEIFEFPYSSITRTEIKTYAGADRIVLGPRVKFPSTIDSGKGNDSITGGEGDDTIQGVGGDDLLVGRGGNDKLIGGLASDRLQGGIGDDLLVPFSEPHYDDTVSGGAGLDHCDYSNETKNLAIFVGGNEGSVAWTDKIQFDVEHVIGGSGNDLLVNESGAPMTLTGGAGNDTLRAGAFGDRLDLGEGLDSVVGGFGPDHIVFGVADGVRDRVDGKQGADVIDDPENRDEIDLVFNV